jgi:hypothetical protein
VHRRALGGRKLNGKIRRTNDVNYAIERSVSRWWHASHVRWSWYRGSIGSDSKSSLALTLNLTENAG